MRGCVAQLRELDAEQSVRQLRIDDENAAMQECVEAAGLGEIVAAKLHRIQFTRVLAEHPVTGPTFMDAAEVPGLLVKISTFNGVRALPTFIAKVSRSLHTSVELALASAPEPRAGRTGPRLHRAVGKQVSR